MADIATILTGSAFRVKLSENESTADIIVIDATVSETVNLEADVTDHPVEDGPDINDHIRPKPVMVEIEGIVSETPLTLAMDLNKMTTSTKDALTSTARSFGGGIGSQVGTRIANQFNSSAGALGGIAGASLFQSDANPAKAARDKLEAMLTGKVIFRLQTKFKIYDNMAITRLSFPRTNETGKALRFAMSCKQVNIVQSETVAAIARSAAGGGTKKADLGKQPPKEAEKPVYKSLAKRAALGLGDAIGGLFKAGE